MKVLITTDWYKPTVNGVVTSVINLKKGLEDMGHSVKILTLSSRIHSHKIDDEIYLGSISMHKVYPNARMKVTLRQRYIKEIIEWKPDIIHSQCEFSTFTLAKKISKKTGAPIVHTYHTVYANYTHYISPNAKYGKMAATLISKRAISGTQAVIAPTDKVRDMLLEYGIEKPIITVPTGLDMSKFSNFENESSRATIRKKFGIDPKEKVLVYVGRLAKEKNIEEIMGYIKEKGASDYKMLIVGGGPHKEALEQKAKYLNIHSKVIFAGMVSPKEVVDYYKAGDVFVSASTSEAQGLTYVEAMASGLPIVCRKDKCLDDVVEDGVNGFLYENYNEFISAIDTLLTENSRREDVRSSAAITAREKYSSESFAANVEKVYLSIVDNAYKNVAV